MPFRTSLPAKQSEIYISKMDLFKLTCPGLPNSIGLFICFTSYGNCANLPWLLPKSSDDLQTAVVFYNTVNFKDMVPVAQQKGISDKLLCYEDCKQSLDAMRGCAPFTAINRTTDACEGLPQRKSGAKCVGQEEYEASLKSRGPSGVDPNNTAAGNASATPGKTGTTGPTKSSDAAASTISAMMVTMVVALLFAAI